MSLTLRQEVDILRRAVKVKSGNGYHYKNVTATILGRVSVKKVVLLSKATAVQGVLSARYSNLVTDIGINIWCKSNTVLHKLYNVNATHQDIVLVLINTNKGEVFYSVMYRSDTIDREWNLIK